MRYYYYYYFYTFIKFARNAAIIIYCIIHRNIGFLRCAGKPYSCDFPEHSYYTIVCTFFQSRTYNYHPGEPCYYKVILCLIGYNDFSALSASTSSAKYAYSVKGCIPTYIYLAIAGWLYYKFAIPANAQHARFITI